MEKQSFFEKRSVVATFGILALLGGFYFINTSLLATGRVTGNTITNMLYPINLVSVIGLLLIICSAILIVYAIVKKN